MEITALLRTIRTKTCLVRFGEKHILEVTSPWTWTNFQTWRGTMCDYHPLWSVLYKYGVQSTEYIDKGL